MASFNRCDICNKEFDIKKDFYWHLDPRGKYSYGLHRPADLCSLTCSLRWIKIAEAKEAQALEDSGM